MFTTAPSIAPVPEAAKTRTSVEVWKRNFNPWRTSEKICSYSGARWWRIGLLMANNASTGMGVGPGVIKYLFIIKCSILYHRKLESRTEWIICQRPTWENSPQNIAKTPFLVKTNHPARAGDDHAPGLRIGAPRSD